MMKVNGFWLMTATSCMAVMLAIKVGVLCRVDRGIEWDLWIWD